VNELVSIVTPTFPGREELLLDRCIPSIMDQTWKRIQHVIVSDPNYDLAGVIEDRDYCNWTDNYTYTFVQINETWRNPLTNASIGAVPWYVGSLLALGEFVGFCGDDDELLPDHAERHVAAMREADAHFSVSQIEFRAGGVPQFNVGDRFEHGRLDATGIMCHKDALQVANWTANGENAADWRLVRDWVNAGLHGTILPAPHTGIHHDGWLVGKTGRPDR
jgi:hypothetical protein